MSILDSINAAEDRAAAMRQDAKVKAREQLHLAEEEAKARRESRLNEEKSARDVRLKAVAEAADQAMAEELAAMDEQNVKLMESARKKKAAAVEFILERVETQ